MTRERDMLFATLAVQLGFASPTDVLACARELLHSRRARRFGQLMVEQRVINDRQLELLESMTTRAAVDTGGDPTITLELLPIEQRELVRRLFASAALEPEALSTMPAGAQRPTVDLAALNQVCLEQPGQYTVVQRPSGEVLELGRGGAGRILLVHDNFLGREVALKELLKEKTTDRATDTLTSSTIEARFLREARLAGQLEHPAVVPVYELGRHGDGSLYYTMMRVRGHSMAEALARAATLHERLRLMPAFLTVCQCMAYAHSRGVMHRDLKPGNVMLGAFAEVYVLDWGLARGKGRGATTSEELRLQEITAQSGIEPVGTPAYMSPEQAWGRTDEVDERSDVWGLGAVLYELLTGQPPYSGATQAEVVTAIRQGEPPPVGRLERKAPRELIAICAKALARERADRYQTAEELARDVKAWLTGRRVTAHTYSSAELVKRFMRKRRAALAAVATLVLGLAIGLAVGVSRVRDERDRARSFAERFLGDVAQKLTPVPGVAPLVRQMSEVALKHYERTTDIAHAPLEQRLAIAASFSRLGVIEAELGEAENAQRNFDFARQLASKAFGQGADAQAGAVYAGALRGLAGVSLARGDAAAASSELAEALPHARRAAAAEPANVEALRTAAGVLGDLGQLAREQKDLAAARGWYEQAVELDEKLRALSLPDGSGELALSQAKAALGALAHADSRLGDARALQALALEAARRSVTVAPSSRANRHNLVRRLLDVADLELVSGSPDRARTLEEEALGEAQVLLAARPDDLETMATILETDVHLGRWSDSLKLVHALEARQALGTVGPVAAAIAWFARDDAEALRLSQLPELERSPTALLYRTLAAAMLDRPGDALVPARSLTTQVESASWLPGAVLAAISQSPAPAPLAPALTDFAKEMDASAAATPPDVPRQRKALATLIAALEARLAHGP